MNLEPQTITKINIVQERVADMISVLTSTQAELIKLLTENRELRTKLKSVMDKPEQEWAHRRTLNEG